MEIKKVGVCSRSFSKHNLLRETLLKEFSNVKFNDQGLKLEGQSLIDFLQDCDAAIVALEKISEDILSALPALNIISKYGVGTDNIDFEALQRHQVHFYSEVGVNRRSVAELVIAFSIALLRSLPQANRLVRDNGWHQIIGSQLSGKTVGIVGCGNVGKDLVTLLKPFNCKIYVHDIVDYLEFFNEYDVENIPLEELLSRSDVISLHVPYDENTRQILSASKLETIKKGAILINTARGDLVDELKLKQLLMSGHIAGAAFDVFAIEPPEDRELLELDNFFATPHIGGSSNEAIINMGTAAIRGLQKYK